MRNLGPPKYLRDCFFAGLEGPLSSSSTKVHSYCFRWSTFGEHEPVDIPCDCAWPTNGYLVAVAQCDGDGEATLRFRLARLPSPLERIKPPCELVYIQIPDSHVYKWDICPLLDLLAVATWGENEQCVYLKFLTIESLLAEPGHFK